MNREEKIEHSRSLFACRVLNEMQRELSNDLEAMKVEYGANEMALRTRWDILCKAPCKMCGWKGIDGRLIRTVIATHPCGNHAEVSCLECSYCEIL